MCPAGKPKAKPFLKEGVDFFFDHERIYLSVSGQEKISQLSLSGSKLRYFFTESTDFQTGVKIFGIDEGTRGISWDTTDQEEYYSIEQKVRDYLKRELGLDFTGYGFGEKNFFKDLVNQKLKTELSSKAGLDSILGGVPDGVLGDQKENIIHSILEIKTVNIHKTNGREDNGTSYLVQTLLYMYLAEVNTGYIAVLRVDSDKNARIKEKEIILTSPLKLVSKDKEQLFSESSSALGNKSFSFSYILSEYHNTSIEDTEFYLFKLQLDISTIQPMIKDMTDWGREYSHQSPKMNEEEFLELQKGI